MFGQKQYGIFMVASLMFACQSTFAAAIECPRSINVTESVSNGQEKWQAFVKDSPHYFSGITLFLGHPRERASLVPQEKSKTKNVDVARWDFSPNESSKPWISCEYLNTNATYTMELPAATKFCEAKYKTFPNTSVTNLLSINCEQ